MVQRLIASKLSMFTVVGLAVMAIGFVFLAFLVEVVGLAPGIAKAVELFTSIFLNYLGNQAFAWRDHRAASRYSTVVKTYAVRLVTAGMAWLIFHALVTHTPCNYLVASAISVGATMGLNYVATDRWVFRTQPLSLSVRRRLSAVARTGAVCAVVVAAYLWVGGIGLGYIALVAMVGMLTFVAASSMWLSLHAWHTPENMEATGFVTPVAPYFTFSLIVPIRGEPLHVIRPTVEALVNQNYTVPDADGNLHPLFQIFLVVSGDDDKETRLAAETLQAEFPVVIRVEYVFGEDKTNLAAGRNKPKALQQVLSKCAGDFVGIIDAESIVAPGLFLRANAKLMETEADVLQCGVQLMNYNDSWYTLHNCLEYYLWFRSRLHWQARQRFITFGGNTIFMSRRMLEELGGWDTQNLTEDCELGVRASVEGYTTAVAYDAQFSTQEETPASLKKIRLQRQRWSQGFRQTYKKGVWRQLPHLRQRLLARYVLVMPAFQAVSGVFVPLSVVLALFVKLPTILALLTFVPLLPALATIAANLVALREFGKEYGLPITIKHYWWLVVGTLPYQFTLSAAAVGAEYREIRGINTWNKTDHSGSHHQVAAASVSIGGAQK